MPPPRKTPFKKCREREFLYLPEVDALIAALGQTRYPIRNQALAILLFGHALQPAELCWLHWRHLNFAENLLRVERISPKPMSSQSQVKVNFQPLCTAEIDILQQLFEQRTTDWIFASERKQRLKERSLHHQIQQAGTLAGLTLSVHPYMLRRTGLYFRAALLLSPLELTLRSCCLLWNWYNTRMPFSALEEQEYHAISRKKEEAFFLALERMKAFTGLLLEENVINYLLGAYLLFPRLKEIPQDYWLAPKSWIL